MKTPTYTHTPKIKNGLIKMMLMDESTRPKRIKLLKKYISTCTAFCIALEAYTTCFTILSCTKCQFSDAQMLVEIVILKKVLKHTNVFVPFEVLVFAPDNNPIRSLEIKKFQ